VRLYVNILNDAGEEAVREAHGANYRRPAAIKRRRDPGALSHPNRDIRPA
jgi:hypothetical protein